MTRTVPSLIECRPPVACFQYVVVLNSQGYFRGHAGKQITFLRVSPNQRFVASGEAGTRPTVRVWDAATSVEVGREDMKNRPPRAGIEQCLSHNLFPILRIP